MLHAHVLGILHGVFNLYGTVEQAIAGMKMKMAKWYATHGNSFLNSVKTEDKIQRAG
jgi:hypothetical protein